MDNTDQLVIVPMKNLAKLGVINILKCIDSKYMKRIIKSILIRIPFLNGSFSKRTMFGQLRFDAVLFERVAALLQD